MSAIRTALERLETAVGSLEEVLQEKEIAQANGQGDMFSVAPSNQNHQVAERIDRAIEHVESLLEGASG